MLIYSILLLYLNNKVLSRSLSMTPLRFVAIIWSCAFFGYFTIKALQISVLPLRVWPGLVDRRTSRPEQYTLVSRHQPLQTGNSWTFPEAGRKFAKWP